MFIKLPFGLYRRSPIYLFICMLGDPHHWLNLEATYQTRNTVFDHIAKHREEN